MYSYSYMKTWTLHWTYLVTKASVDKRDLSCCEQTVWTDGLDINYKHVAQSTNWTKTTNFPQCHHGVVVITCASHAQGQQFKPTWWQHFFINGCCTAFPASTTKNRPSKTATHPKGNQSNWIGPKNLKAFIKILHVIKHFWMIRIGPNRIKLSRLRVLKTDCKNIAL